MKKNLFLLLAALLVVTSFTGCKRSQAVETSEEPTSEVVSEVVSEEPSEVVSEEPSEEVSEEVSEEPSEETKEVEEVNFANASEVVEHVKATNEIAIVECNFAQEGSSQFVIPNGANYTMQMGKSLMIIPAKEVSTVESNVDEITVMPSPIEGVWGVILNSTGTDIEISVTIKYADGTEEDILLYVTNTFE